MQAIKQLKRLNHTQWRSISQLSAEDIVITSAVRTPLGFYGSCLAALTSGQLGAVAINGALMRSRVLPEEVQALYLNNAQKTDDGTAELANLIPWLSKNLHHINGTDGLQSITAAVEALKRGKIQSALAGSICRASAAGNLARVVTATIDESELEEQQAYIQASIERAHCSFSAGLFAEELVPVRIQRDRRAPNFMNTDEIFLTPVKSKCDYGKVELADGAAALVLATSQMAERWQLRPLARIVNYVEVEQTPKNRNAAAMAASQLLQCSKVKKEHIAMWEVDEPTASVPLTFIKQSKVNPLYVNMHGGAISLGYPLGMSSVRALTHLLHALQPGALGCAVACHSADKATAVLIQKISNSASNRNTLPKLTLYTKDPCPLCDMVLEELEQCFTGQCDIVKVFIDEEGNERLFAMFKNDIPVLFLNGQFLCMHKLNTNLLKRKLEEREKIT